MKIKSYLDTTISGVELTAFYTIYIETDPYGTGDSPTSYELDILHIEAKDSTINLMSILSYDVIEEIENEIIQQGKE
jgi:hypothetical protein